MILIVKQDLIPGTTADKIIHYDTRCYSGQFSDDGKFFFCCGQDFRVRMYDTSNPYDWKYYKRVRYHGVGQWTITDATLSPDNRYLAYSSIHHEVSLAPTDPYDTSDPMSLDFSNSRQGRGGYRHWGVCSYYSSDSVAVAIYLLIFSRYGHYGSPATGERLLPARLIDQS